MTSRARKLFAFALPGMMALALPSVVVSATTPSSNSPGLDLPELGPKSPPQDILHCERYFEYRGRILPCDSPVAPDGKGLHPILSAVPEARRELEVYQENRPSSSMTAYTGMAGLLAAAILPRLLNSPGAKNTAVVGGISVTLLSFAWGRARISANELRLQRAIQHYNNARPDDPVLLIEKRPQPQGAP